MPDILRRHGRSLIAAVMKFNRDDGWAIASHITLSGILALFPFLIFCASLVAFFDLGEFPATVVHLIFDYWPASVAKPISSEVLAVLTEQRRDVMTFGAAAALFFASSGIEALRLGLNRAYGAQEARNVFLLRGQSILFVLIASILLGVTTFLLVLLPVLEDVAGRHAPWLHRYLVDIGSGRLVTSSAILVAGLYASHKWLPASPLKFTAMLPGIVLTLVLWLTASAGFATYLRTFANYGGTYAGLAGVIVALVFVYIMSAIYLIGAEYNAALRDMN